MSFNIGDRVTLVESSKPGRVIKTDHYNICVEDEDGRQHVFLHGTDKIVPQSFLTESN
jgi:hypothetical protein